MVYPYTLKAYMVLFNLAKMSRHRVRTGLIPHPLKLHRALIYRSAERFTASLSPETTRDIKERSEMEDLI